MNKVNKCFLFAELGLDILAVEAGYMVDSDVFGTFHLAGAGVGAVAESEFIHLGYHCTGATGGFRLTLRQ